MRSFIFKSIVLSIFSVSFFSCVGNNNDLPENYSPADIRYAEYLRMGDCGDYILVDIVNPWDTTRLLQRYLLIDSLQPVPEDIPDGKIVKTPVDNIVVYSSVHTSIIEKLGAVERIAGVCEPEYILSQAVREKVRNGEIADCGKSLSPSVEKIIQAQGRIIIASPFENNSYASAEKLSLPIIEGADYMENNPLGRAEWIKLYGYLLGVPEMADSIFAEIESNYNSLKNQVAQAIAAGKQRPTMISEKKYGNSWGVPGGLSYISVMYEDAGAKNIFADYRQTGSVMLSFEEVFTKGINADYWFFKYNSDGDYTYEDLLGEYPLYEKFDAFKNRKIFGCNTSYVPYYDDITLRPDMILADFIKIFHPELLPDYTLKYFLPLK